MQLTNKIIEKFGYDKLLHFLVAAWVVSICNMYGIGAGCIAWVAIVILSIIKEKVFDDYLDAKDIFAGALGGFTSLVLNIIYIWLKNFGI